MRARWIFVLLVGCSPEAPERASEDLSPVDDQEALVGIGGAGCNSGNEPTIVKCGATNCVGTCVRCNTLTQRCEPNPSLCLGDCAECSGSLNSYNCYAKPSLCGGNCGTCSSCGEREHQCIRNPAACTGNCSKCGRDDESGQFECQPYEGLCPGTCSQCEGSGTNFSCERQGCLPGTCQPCGSGKVRFCQSSCGWGACVSGFCP